MSGGTLYETRRHECRKPPSYAGGPGSVWRCACGRYWRWSSWGLWDRMGALRVWWWKRRNTAR